MFNISKIMFRARATCRNWKQSPVFMGPTNFISTLEVRKKKKKKERPLKELYKCHSSNPFFLALRSHSLTTNTHHLNTHTQATKNWWWQEHCTTHKHPQLNPRQKKKKTVQHHCLQHSSQGLCTHPRLNQKKKKLFYQSSQGKSSAVICDRESHQKACLAVRHRHSSTWCWGHRTVFPFLRWTGRV